MLISFQKFFSLNSNQQLIEEEQTKKKSFSWAKLQK